MPNLRAGNPEGETMIPLRNLFEGHLTVTDLKRSMAFFGDTLGLELARAFPEGSVLLDRRARPVHAGRVGSGDGASAAEPPPGLPG